MKSHLEHLISDEEGTSNWLATLLDPAYDSKAFQQARDLFAGLIGSSDIALTSTSPTFIERECLDFDLLLVWSDWLILVENKVAAASVTGGQLQRYHDTLAAEVARGFALGGMNLAEHRICVVYLTPRGAGLSEFDSLDFGSRMQDRKVHLAWEDLLNRLGNGCTKETPVGQDQWIVFEGIRQVQTVLERARTNQLPDEPVRNALRAIIRDIESSLAPALIVGRGLTAHRWSSRLYEQLFVCGTSRIAYVTLYVSHPGSEIPDEGRIRTQGKLAFELAAKQRKPLRQYLLRKPREEWYALLGVGVDQTAIDINMGNLTWSFECADIEAEVFVAMMVERICRFVAVFREVLEGLPGTLDGQ